MAHFFFGLGIIYGLFQMLAGAWYDEGHMLVGEIASIVLDNPSYLFKDNDIYAYPWLYTSQNALKVLNGLLYLWSDDFPDFHDITSAATWADHIKCTSPGSFCRSDTHVFDGIEIFNNEHFVDIPYRAQEMELDNNTVKRFLTIPGNAYYLLQQISRSLSPRLSLRDAGILTLREVMTMDKETLRQHIWAHNRTITYALRTEPFARSSSPLSIISYRNLDTSTGTVFSTNLLIRLFIHIWGDIHQPLHTISLIDPPCFPRGDRGGTEVIIKVNTSLTSGSGANASDCEVTSLESTLHSLWDGMGLTHTTSGYPLSSRQEIHEQAKKLINDHPITQANRSSILVDIHEVFQQSHALAPIVYDEVLQHLASRCPTFHTPFEPSSDYINQVREITRRQIALAGYRLAAFLNMFVNDFNDDLRSKATKQTDAKKVVSFGNTSLVLSSVSSLLLMLNGVLLFSLWKKNRVPPYVPEISDHNTPLLVDS